MTTPLQHGKARVDAIINPGIVATQTIVTLSMKRLDELLRDACLRTSNVELVAWRKTYVEQHPTATVSSFLTHADKEFNSRQNKRKWREAQNETLVKDLLTEEAKALEDAAFDEQLKKRCIANEDDDTGLYCGTCCNTYPPTEVISCKGNALHVICHKCLAVYCKTNVSKHSVESLPCVVCKGGYDRTIIKAAISPVLFDKMQKNQAELDVQVLLAANVRAVLYCECGTVAVVEDKDIGSGIVTCFCNKAYCITCGNYQHSGELCPPPKETVKWLSKHTKQCPNCKTNIQKNGGCNHMTCNRCHYAFCWLCLEKYSLECLCVRQRHSAVLLTVATSASAPLSATHHN